MAETVYITQWIKDMLTNMIFSDKEKTNLLLGDRISENEIYVTNATVPFNGEATSVSLESIPDFNRILGAVLFANRAFRERGGSWGTGFCFFLLIHIHAKLEKLYVPATKLGVLMMCLQSMNHQGGA